MFVEQFMTQRVIKFHCVDYRDAPTRDVDSVCFKYRLRKDKSDTWIACAYSNYSTASIYVIQTLNSNTLTIVSL